MTLVYSHILSMFHTGILQVEQNCLGLSASLGTVIMSGRLSVALLVLPRLSIEGVDEGGPLLGAFSFKDIDDVMIAK